jgi:hypothetical protein
VLGIGTMSALADRRVLGVVSVTALATGTTAGAHLDCRTATGC